MQEIRSTFSPYISQFPPFLTYSIHNHSFSTVKYSVTFTVRDLSSESHLHYLQKM